MTIPTPPARSFTATFEALYDADVASNVTVDGLTTGLGPSPGNGSRSGGSQFSVEICPRLDRAGDRAPAAHRDRDRFAVDFVVVLEPGGASPAGRADAVHPELFIPISGPPSPVQTLGQQGELATPPEREP